MTACLALQCMATSGTKTSLVCMQYCTHSCTIRKHMHTASSFALQKTDARARQPKHEMLLGVTIAGSTGSV